MNDKSTEIPGHDHMEVLSLTVNEEIEREVDEELPHEMINEGLKFEMSFLIVRGPDT